MVLYLVFPCSLPALACASGRWVTSCQYVADSSFGCWRQWDTIKRKAPSYHHRLACHSSQQLWCEACPCESAPSVYLNLNNSVSILNPKINLNLNLNPNLTLNPNLNLTFPSQSHIYTNTRINYQSQSQSHLTSNTSINDQCLSQPLNLNLNLNLTFIVNLNLPVGALRWCGLERRAHNSDGFSQ